MKKKLMLIMTFLLILLLSGCSKKEDEIQYAPKDEVREDIMYKFPIEIPKYTRDTQVFLLNKYRVNLYIDFAGMYYDETTHTIGILLDSSNGNNSDITIKAEAIVNGNKENVESTEYEVILGKDVSVERDLKIRLNKEFNERLDSIELILDLSSSSGKRLNIAPYKIENFYSWTMGDEINITPEVSGGGILSGSDIWLDEEIDVDSIQYEQLTGRSLAEVIAERDGISREEAKEQIRQQEIEKIDQAASEQKAIELKAAGNKRIGNDVLGYLEVPEGCEEKCNENERIEYSYEDELGSYTISMYLDNMDMNEVFPYSIFLSDKLDSYISEGCETVYGGGVTLKEEKGVVVVAWLYYIIENNNEEPHLIIMGSTENPLDATKAIVVEIKYSVNSEANKANGLTMMETYKHSFYNKIF